jgi:magnesium transporter
MRQEIAMASETATVIEIQPWDRLHELAENGDVEGLRDYIRDLDRGDAIRALLRLDPTDRFKVITALMPGEAADLIEECPDEQAAEIIENVPPDIAAAIVAEMWSDEAADLLGDLEQDDADAILKEMAPAEAAEARELAGYDDETAGGLMITEYLKFDENMSIGNVADSLQERGAELEDYFSRYAFVVSARGRLAGVVETRNLVLTPRETLISDAMVPARFTTADANLDTLRSFFETYDFAAAPVVDKNGRLIGVVRRTALREALAERAGREMMRMQGIVGGDEIRSLPLFTRTRRRLSWLSVNIVLNIMAASVIALYLDTLEAVIALAVFLPIISDMSGNSGFQAVAVSMRELALGIVKPYEAFRVWRQEISVGLINGAALGILLGAVAWLWKGNLWLGVVVGTALALNTLISVSIGGTMPLLLKRLRIDPAVAAGPILTTVTDICGFFIVLSLAALMISRLAT